MGIERKLEQKHKETDKNISVAFEDLSKLMEKVSLCVIHIHFIQLLLALECSCQLHVL